MENKNRWWVCIAVARVHGDGDAYGYGGDSNMNKWWSDVGFPFMDAEMQRMVSDILWSLSWSQHIYWVSVDTDEGDNNNLNGCWNDEHDRVDYELET